MPDVEEPSGMWPTLPPLPPEVPPEPRRWVWEAMEPVERQQRLRDLAVWVDWIRVTFELHNTIPACWFRHPPVREHLTALYVGWVRIYAGPQEPQGLAEADWLNTLHALTPRLKSGTCAAGTHQPPPALPATSSAAGMDFEAHLATSPEMTAAARHPAEAEARRLNEEAQPPL